MLFVKQEGNFEGNSSSYHFKSFAINCSLNQLIGDSEAFPITGRLPGQGGGGVWRTSFDFLLSVKRFNFNKELSWASPVHCRVQKGSVPFSKGNGSTGAKVWVCQGTLVLGMGTMGQSFPTQPNS